MVHHLNIILFLRHTHHKNQFLFDLNYLLFSCVVHPNRLSYVKLTQSFVHCSLADIVVRGKAAKAMKGDEYWKFYFKHGLTTNTS